MVCSVVETRRDVEAVGIHDRIGPAIAHYRTQKSMTVRELARKVGITEGAIRHYESGRQLPPVDRIEAIADALEISPFLLLMDTDTLPLTERFVLAVEELPPEDLRMLEEILSRLLRTS